MSKSDIETEVIEESINNEDEMEAEIIVPDEPEINIYEESTTENQVEQTTQQTGISTITTKPITTINSPQLLKDGKSVQYKLLNINGTMKLVQLNLPEQTEGSTPITFINQHQLDGAIQIKNGPIAPVSMPTPQSCDVEPSEYRLWSTNATKLLIELYKKYINRVGTGEIKTWKKCWEQIADDINKLVPEVNISGCHAENRWRVLARNYRKYLSKGKFKKFFEYAKEFDEINSMKDHPYTAYKGQPPVDEIPQKNIYNPNKNHVMLITQSKPGNTNITSAKYMPIRPAYIGNQLKNASDVSKKDNIVRKKFSKVNVFLNMRKDRLRYYKQRIAIEKAKLQLEREKVTALKIKNKLMKERNDILCNFNKNTVLYDICGQ